MSSRRAAPYATRDAKASTAEVKKGRLRKELKTHLSSVSDYPILSAEWVALAEAMRQVSVVACVELRAPATEAEKGAGASAAAAFDAHGKDKSGGTLWDQQREEMAVRLLLEEGKLNLAMRLLHLESEAARAPDWNEKQREAAERLKMSVGEIAAAVRNFEVGVGTLLALAYRHVEALQILDVSEMLAHVAEVAEHAATAPPDVRFDGTQPAVVGQYAAALAQRIDSLDEDRVCDVMEERGVLRALVRHHHSNYWRLTRESLQGLVLFLAYFAESETFCTEPERFVPCDETARQICDLLAWSLDGLMADRLVLRNNVHSLKDHVRRWERRVGKSQEKPREPNTGGPRQEGAGGEPE